MTIRQQHFGTTSTGESVELFTLSSAQDNAKDKTQSVEVSIINLGGIIQSLRVPDRAGGMDDIVLGYDTVAEYESCQAYLGCIAGRFANRIANGRFTLDDAEYVLEQNDGENHLHSASAGFNRVVWSAQLDEETLVLTYVSADGHGGYPGALTTEVRYALTAQNELRIEYRATTDKATVLNLTNHSYFNLLGQQHAIKNSVLKHELTLHAARYVPTDTGSIPLGHLADVAGTPMDFQSPTAIGARIDQDDEQLRFGSGYDHTWVLDHAAGELGLAARVVEPTTGRVLEVHTTQPSVQFYTSNQMSRLAGKGGAEYDSRSALCLETQHFPDSPNQPDFPSTVLRPDETFHEVTVFRFDTL